MMKGLKTLTKLQFYNLCNLNVARYSKDKHKKNQLVGLGIAYVFVIVMLVFYVGAFSYGFVKLGLQNVLPAYLTAITGIIIFFFTMLKTGSVIFEKNSYDTLCSLPISQSAIVISRFIRMYVGNLLISFAVMLPGMGVYAFLLHPAIGFYLTAFIGTLFIPMLPITLATFFGAIVTAISSRLKHKSIVSAVLSVILVFGIMFGSSQFSRLENGEITEMLHSLADSVSVMLGKIYPPAIWLGDAVVGISFYKFFVFIGVSLLAFIAITALVSVTFHSVCRQLYSIYAKHNYKMCELKKSSVLSSLVKREFKRYTASSIYITNTIVGPVMGFALAVAVLVFGKEKIESIPIPIKFDVTMLVTIAFSVVFCIMTTTCTSISMEGKEWWITKSLPIKTKTVIDSKILMNLLVFAPFYFVSEILLIIALKPDLSDALWLIVLPVIFILFSCVFGITINLLFPSFDWENEVTVVKQSFSSGVGGLGGCVIVIIASLPILIISFIPQIIIRLAVSVIILGLTVLLYKKDINVDFQKLG